MVVARQAFGKLGRGTVGNLWRRVHGIPHGRDSAQMRRLDQECARARALLTRTADATLPEADGSNIRGRRGGFHALVEAEEATLLAAIEWCITAEGWQVCGMIRGGLLVGTIGRAREREGMLAAIDEAIDKWGASGAVPIRYRLRKC